MDKFKVGDKVVKSSGRPWAEGGEYKIIKRACGDVYSLINSPDVWREYELKSYKKK